MLDLSGKQDANARQMRIQHEAEQERMQGEIEELEAKLEESVRDGLITQRSKLQSEQSALEWERRNLQITQTKVTMLQSELETIRIQKEYEEEKVNRKESELLTSQDKLGSALEKKNQELMETRGAMSGYMLEYLKTKLEVEEQKNKGQEKDKNFRDVSKKYIQRLLEIEHQCASTSGSVECVRDRTSEIISGLKQVDNEQKGLTNSQRDLSLMDEQDER